MSFRSDILSPVYAIALTKLQDKLAPFDSTTAKKMIQEELLVNKGSVAFESMDDIPLAAASLGQVYKAKMRFTNSFGSNDDELVEVAVKVQRPYVRETICLDLYLMRLAAPFLRRRYNLNSDLEALVDEWGLRFLAELDYLSEANNAINFNQQMEVHDIFFHHFTITIIVTS